MDRGTVGKTVVSNLHPSTIDYYWFIVNLNIPLNTFDFVSVNNIRGTRTVGMVQDMIAGVPMDGNEYSFPRNKRNVSEPLLAKVAVIGNTGVKNKEGQSHKTISVNFPVMTGKEVSFSTKKEVLSSLGVPKMETPIPAGIIELSNGLQIPISLDLTYLAGPDTAHVNVSGISGNRKSSYILFLLQSAYQTLRHIEGRRKEHERKGACLIVFNTKEDDLLYLDQKKRRGEMGSDARRAFKILDLVIEPFSNVTYFLPRGKDGEPNSLHVPLNHKTYSYELVNIFDRLHLLFSSTPEPHDIMPIVNYIRESWPLEESSGNNISNWTDLSKFTDYPKSIVSHISALQGFIGQIQRFRESSLFIDRRVKSVYLGEQAANVKSGDVFVIDLAPLPSVEEQALVIGDILKSINGLYSVRYPISGKKKLERTVRGKKPPKYVLIFLDEINRFMPKSHYFPKFNSVSDEIMRLVIGGRSRGNILFSAQQFKSATDYRFQENIDLHIFAKLGLSELLTEPYYSMIDDMVKKNIARLERGEMVLVHPAFRHPLKIWFPPSSYKRR